MRRHNLKLTAADIAGQINGLLDSPIRLMEVCGTHTEAIFRYGLRQLLDKRISLVSGPGCPVCVTSQQDIDRIIELSRIKDAMLVTFGDMLRVPGTSSSLEKERGRGAQIKVIYSPLQALELAKENPGIQVIFIGIGFETTAPLVGSLISDAYDQGVRNLSVYSCHKTVVPALKAIAGDPDMKVDGFICPGHVSSVIGSNAYLPIARGFGMPCVISGFEPADILASILLLVLQLKNSLARVQNQYQRVVSAQGNKLAQKMISRVFESSPADWRGLGVIDGSGLAIRKEYSKLDASKVFRIKKIYSKDNSNCSCADILKGIKTPVQCRMFAKSCTPDRPLGPCMISSEGACSAWFKYSRKEAVNA